MFAVRVTGLNEESGMSIISLDLPEDLYAFAEEKAKRCGFSDASEYIVALVAATSEKRSEIELALIDGLDSGPTQAWTDSEWQSIRSRVIALGKDV